MNPSHALPSSKPESAGVVPRTGTAQPSPAAAEATPATTPAALGQSPRSVSMPVPRFALDPVATRAIPTLPAGLPPRALWKKRRFWILAGAAAAIVSTLSTAIVRGRHTRIIIINSGNETLPALTVSAAGHHHSIPPLESGASHRWVLPEGGSSTPIIVEASAPEPDSTAHHWEGSAFAPGHGARRILRLNADGSIEESSSASIWLDLIGS